MKSPLWILNSSLATLLFGLLLFIFLSRPKVVQKTPLTPLNTGETVKLDTPSIDPSLIYKNDIFGTYIESRPPAEEQPVKKTVVPLPPTAKTTPVAQPIPPQFLPPLAISLKGIIYSQDETDNRAIISDNKTKKESLYKLGDKVLDAEIIHISNNKVMFIRSNGQQETVFVTQGDAQADPVYNQHHTVETLAKKVSDLEYIVYQDTFAQRVHNLAQFIDTLDITTAFHKGKILGVRVGKFEDSSFGSLLGLRQGDVITSINGMPTTTTKHRVAIYNRLKEITEDTTIAVDMLRQGRVVTLQYLVKTSKQPVEQGEAPTIAKQNKRENIQEKTTLDSENVNPTAHHERSRMTGGDEHPEPAPVIVPNLQNIQKRDSSAMFNHGGRNSLLQQTQS